MWAWQNERTTARCESGCSSTQRCAESQSSSGQCISDMPTAISIADVNSESWAIRARRKVTVRSQLASAPSSPSSSASSLASTAHETAARRGSSASESACQPPPPPSASSSCATALEAASTVGKPVGATIARTSERVRSSLCPLLTTALTNPKAASVSPSSAPTRRRHRPLANQTRSRSSRLWAVGSSVGLRPQCCSTSGRPRRRPQARPRRRPLHR
mmetsp:Transcript_35767/g.82849  ORF Transcript_35767/g.82849 Transcript_35767/m.82849 type:complete len:217 (-) Transcript_35767:241-891(-)